MHQNKEIKIKIILMINMILTISTACQKSPLDVTENENGVKIENKETMAAMESEKLVENKDLQVPDHIQTSFEGIDYLVNIDCDIQKSNSEITIGNLTPRDISLEKIRDILDPNEEWTLRDGNYYVFQPANEQSEELNALIQLKKRDDGYIEYDLADNERFPAMAAYVEKNEQTGEMQEYSERCKLFANNVLEQLNLQCTIMDESFYALEKQWYVSYRLQFMIDDIPICDYFSMNTPENTMKKILGDITLTDVKIGNLSFTGAYYEASKQSAILLDWDDIMNSFKLAIEEGNTKYKINDIFVSRIQLEYYVRNDWSYVPVWTFYIRRMDGEYPAVCINACTGETMYDW